MGSIREALKRLLLRLRPAWSWLLDVTADRRRRYGFTVALSFILHVALLAYLAIPRPPTLIYPPPPPWQPPDVVITMIPPPEVQPPEPPPPLERPKVERWPTPPRPEDQQVVTPAPSPPAPAPPQPTPEPRPPSPPAPIAPPTPAPPRPEVSPLSKAPPTPPAPPAPSPTRPTPAPPAPRATIIAPPRPSEAIRPSNIHRAPVSAPDSPIQSFRAPENLFAPGTQAPATAPSAGAGTPSGAPSGAPGGSRVSGLNPFPSGVLPGPGRGGGGRANALTCRNPDLYNLGRDERQRCIEILGTATAGDRNADAIASSRARLTAEAAAVQQRRALQYATGPGVGPSSSDVPTRGSGLSSPDGGTPGNAGNPAGPAGGRIRDLPGQASRPADVGGRADHQP